MIRGGARSNQEAAARTRTKEQYGNSGELPSNTSDALIQWAKALRPDEDAFEYTSPSGENPEFATGTVETYLREMRKVAVRACPDLLQIDAETFNDEIELMHSGENPHVPDSGLAKTTLMITQSAGRSFFWYHGIADPEAITIYDESSEPRHDESDLFTRKEVQALRTEIENPRNRAILEMLLNTGQRISAIQGLRIKDIDIDAGTFTLNTEREGLKRADQRGLERPLFGAESFVAAWLNEHPFAEDSRAYLFIGDPEHHKTKPDEPLCQGTIRRMLEIAAEKADVTKPVNPHNFRHYWTTIMKEDYGLNDEEIKYLMGHKRSGNGANAVYNHTRTEVLRENILQKRGDTDYFNSKPLTPKSCHSCGETLESHWKVCPVCGIEYSP